MEDKGKDIINPPVEIYQFRVWIKKISPMVWRRLLVRNDTSVAALHHILQIVMHWECNYLHQFKIQGRTYGISYEGGVGFRDNPHQIYLNQFQFRINECFDYEYNFYAEWQLEIRLEQHCFLNPKKFYPRCIGGRGKAPSEDIAGAIAFMQQREENSGWRTNEKLLKLLKRYQADKVDTEDFQEKLQELISWANPHRFNRRAVNHTLKNLQQYTPQGGYLYEY